MLTYKADIRAHVTKQNEKNMIGKKIPPNLKFITGYETGFSKNSSLQNK